MQIPRDRKGHTMNRQRTSEVQPDDDVTRCANLFLCSPCSAKASITFIVTRGCPEQTKRVDK
eukprot:1145733-Pelagomonas_calceolata.AAC.2